MLNSILSGRYDRVQRTINKSISPGRRRTDCCAGFTAAAGHIRLPTACDPGTRTLRYSLPSCWLACERRLRCDGPPSGPERPAASTRCRPPSRPPAHLCLYRSPPHGRPTARRQTIRAQPPKADNPRMRSWYPISP